MASVTPVVLLHGLGRTPGSMASLARRLAEHGHPTLVPGYPSRRCRVRDCALALGPDVEAFRRHTGREIAFVTHSMGGLVARCLATALGGTRAIVMLRHRTAAARWPTMSSGFGLAGRCSVRRWPT